MADSIAWFTYVSDRGEQFSIFNDRSKATAAISGAGTALEAFVPQLNGLPRTIRPRYVNAYNQNNPLQKARIKIGSVESFNLILSGTTISEPAGNFTVARIWVVTSKVPERERLANGTDTGLIA